MDAKDEPKVKAVVESTIEALGARLRQAYPEIASGDVAPLEQVRLERELEQFVVQWVEVNRTPTPTVAGFNAPDLRQDGRRLSYVQGAWEEHTGGGVMVDFVQLYGGQILTITDEFVILRGSYADWEQSDGDDNALGVLHRDPAVAAAIRLRRVHLQQLYRLLQEEPMG